VDRRKFLAGAAVAGAATAIPAVKHARAADAEPSSAFVKRPSTAAAQAELATTSVAPSPGTLAGPPGSDFMVDVLRSLNIDFVFSNPASSCRGIHESIVNYGGNTEPVFATCMHEESTSALTHCDYKIAMTPPHEPVLMVLEEKLQESAMLKGEKPLTIPKLNLVAPPAGDPNAVREAARLLAMADNPVIVADRVARTPAGIKHLVDLAEALNAPVIDQLGRMNMPNNQY